ncbi:nucleotidyltransferase domain-containing protein [bacterium D16-51]|nr:nucleotidyltransferase domain-containing protein [bacterium D16-59]RKI59616.1 nucleotidyltransferase domain-containing protein [bacterium D16-51]
MDRNKAIELSKVYSNEVKNAYEPYKVMLYGSYCRNEQTKDSDIDIAVIFDGFSGDWLKTSSDLWRMTEKVNTIIEPVLLDMQSDPSGFCEHVIETGIEL